MSAMKLQKLVYYAQAWALVWDEEPLFPEHIEAWANGPVVPALYARHQGQFKVTSELINGDPTQLASAQKETVDAVCDAFCTLNAQELSDMTHAEAPWRKARGRAGLRDGERGHETILHADMAEYYGGLPQT